MSKFNAVHFPLRPNDIANMADSRPACGTQVENLGLLPEGDLAKSLQDRSCKLTPERIPNSILFIASFDDFLSVNGLSRRQAAGTEPLFPFPPDQIDPFESSVGLDAIAYHASSWVVVLDNDP